MSLVSPSAATLAPPPSLSELLRGLSSHDDVPRKLAAFRLQSYISEPVFAERFVAQGGLPRLTDLIHNASGNTLSYGLASFSRLLEMGQGWPGVDSKMILRAVELVVCEPLVNILRGALSVLVSIVARPQNDEDRASSSNGTYMAGFKALKPAIGLYPQFLEMLVSRLSSADHSLCANALQLINSLMRDAIANDNEQEWPKFTKRIQDLGVIKAVYILMQSSALHDLAGPLLDFQSLTKVLLRRWRMVPVNLNRPEHRRTIKALHLSSNPGKSFDAGHPPSIQPKHNPYKWRRLGFATESPEQDFTDMGFLGLMDFSDYVRKHQEEFQHILLEQQVNQTMESRCPLARASLVVTAVLFEHFEIDKTDTEDLKKYLSTESSTSYDHIFKPLLLHWSRLHGAGLHAFFRLWHETKAQHEDFFRIVELIRILVESVVGGAGRTKSIEQIEQELASYQCSKLRELQMELLELTYEDIWGQHLRSIREELRSESLQFVKEQRIRSLLEGAWFPTVGRGHEGEHITEAEEYRTRSYRFIRLGADRKLLHYGDFVQIFSEPPSFKMLPNKLDLAIVSSVVSDVTARGDPNARPKEASQATLQEQFTTTQISIHGYTTESRMMANESRTGHRRAYSKNAGRPNYKEKVLLTFQPPNHIVAAEWLDGLLMLLDQQPITAETNNLIGSISDYGLKVRLLNVRYNDEEGLISGIGGGLEPPQVPSRDGVDDDYYYEI